MARTSSSIKNRRMRHAIALLVGAGLTATVAPMLAPTAAQADSTAPALQIQDSQLRPADATHAGFWKMTNQGTDYTTAFGSGATSGQDGAGYTLNVGAVNFTSCPGDPNGHVELYLNPAIETSLTAAGTSLDPTTTPIFLPALEPYSTFGNVAVGDGTTPNPYTYLALFRNMTGQQGGDLGDDGWWRESTGDGLWGTDMSTVGGLASVMAPGNKYTLGLACVDDTNHLVPDPSNASDFLSVQSYVSVNTDGSWSLSADPTAPIGTTTSLAVSSASSKKGAAVTLTATTPNGVAGSVDFYNGSTKLGTATVADGKATLNTSVLPAGTDSLKATFTPDNAAADEYHQLGSSTSAAVTHQVQAPATTTPPAGNGTTTPAPPVVNQKLVHDQAKLKKAKAKLKKLKKKLKKAHGAKKTKLKKKIKKIKKQVKKDKKLIKKDK